MLQVLDTVLYLPVIVLDGGYGCRIRPGISYRGRDTSAVHADPVWTTHFPHSFFK